MQVCNLSFLYVMSCNLYYYKVAVACVASSRLPLCSTYYMHFVGDQMNGQSFAW